MKKIFYILPTVLIYFLILLGYGVKINQASAQTRTQSQEQTWQDLKLTISPTGNQIQNTNRLNTQNRGEEEQLRINNQDQEGIKDLISGEIQKQTEKINQEMNEASLQMNALLDKGIKGGVVEQARQMTQEQSRIWEKIQEQLNKLDSRPRVLKILIGADYGLIKNLKQQLEQNKLRIKQLEQLKNQLNNESELSNLQETIKSLIQQNTFLQNKLEAEEKAKSLFGWLFRLFNK